MVRKTEKLKAIDLFAGIGGVRIGFESAGFDIVYSNDFNEKAAETYRMNFDEIDESDILEVAKENNVKRIPKKIDILLAGFPCQPFSVAGKGLGFEDEGRGKLIFAVIDLLKKRKPAAVFLENVKNLQYHDDKKTFKKVEEVLSDAGYKWIKAQVLNSMDYGNVPQTRERIYIVGFREKKHFDKFCFPEKEVLTATMSSILEKDVDDKYYYSEKDKIIYPRLKEVVNHRDRFYQYRRVYVRENKSGVCPTLTASMGMGGHNVPIIRDQKGIRKLTPRECARLQGFPESFLLPENQADNHLYRQIGNSVTVPVVARIAENIRITLES
ncbi:MAG: DNA (cytosine-5-)-methyltransferase [Alphaproteobacteria bacterium]|nr:DNA (cytosine-5-)-methyltransferase [Alphaproteobacteria bacterium]